MTHSSVSPDCWLAPAKLNLFLHVTGRREGGYHTLQTAFIFLDCYDRLWFEVNETGEVSRQDEKGLLTVHLPEEDLCVQAAKALQKHCGVSQGVSIFLQKRIPLGAGLGGGSSDAATVLLALNKLWEVDLDRENLIKIGRNLGADVPVFIHGENTLAQGIGDIFTPFRHPVKVYCVIIPQIHVSSAEIFSDSALTRDTPIQTIRGSLPTGHRNDLQAVTCKRFPAVKMALKWLQQFGEARMSGSGGSVFVACDTLDGANKILGQMPAEMSADEKVFRVDGFVAHSLLCHPHKS